MPKRAMPTLSWSAEQTSYGLFVQNDALLQAESPAWFAWLATHTSFSFQGQHGSLHLQKETRPRGKEGYWYAYRRQGKRMVKHYVGRSADLSMARLEAVARTLGTRSQISTVPPASLEPSEPQDQRVLSALLVSKLRPPRLPSSLVERSRLLTQLDGGFSRKLTLLTAPAGFGKTTVVSQWVSDRRVRGLLPPVAWVALDSEDNDPVRFWRYVLTACQAFQTDLGSSSLALLVADQPLPFVLPPLKAVLTMFLNEVTDHACQGVLILEDYHVITSSQIAETLAFLLDHLPSALHVVLMTRSEPPLPLARWRARDELLEIHASDMRFSLEETRRFLQQALPFSSSSEVTRRLETHLEGWAAGLRLLTLALRGRSDQQEIEQFFATFTGKERHLLDYFVTEVLDVEPEPLQTFLLQTSMFNRLTASLCDTVTGRTDSQAVLEAVERAGLFLQPIEGEEPWYRYHALFAEAMRAEARRRLDEDTLHMCLNRASMWYEQHGFLPEAIEARLDASAYEHAVVLIERYVGGQHSTERHELYTLQRWLEHFPKDVLHQAPALCFLYAYVLTFTSASDQLAPALLTQVKTLLHIAEQTWQSEGHMPKVGEVFAFHALLTARRGKAEEAAALARQALAWLSEEQYEWRTICLGAIGEEEHLAGRFAVARTYLLESLSLCEATHNRPGIRVTSILLGEVCSESGDLHQAAAFYRQALSPAEEDMTDRAKALVGLAQLSYEWNNLEQAEREAQEALDLGLQLNDESLQVRAQIMLARLWHARGETERARQQYASLSARVQPTRSPLLYREVLIWQACLLLSLGDLPPLQRLIGELQALHDDVLPLLSREREAILRARWLLAQEKTHEALHLLEHWGTSARASERTRSIVEIQFLMCMAYHMLKQEHEARSRLGEVLALARAEGYLRLFLDEGEPMATLLRAMVSQMREKSLLTYLQRVLRAFDAEHASKILSSVPSHRIEELSPQEQQVLRLLAEGHSRQDIAETLVISINTVKTHLQRIYQKLNVSNRFEAYEVARHLYQE